MRMIKSLVAVAFVSSMVACGGAETMTVPMAAQSGSAETGTAKLTELRDSKTQVDITITAGSDTGAQPAHIHNGDCTTLGSIYQELTSVTAGKSTTIVNVPFETFKNNPSKYAINVHNSQTLSTYVSCGTIK